MRIGSSALALAASMWIGPPVVANAAPLPQLKSLRHLVFSYTYDIRQFTESPDDAASNPSSGEQYAISGNTKAGLVRSGTIEIDVVAATGDNGLVADVREGDGVRLSDPVRCTISSDTSVVFDPQSNVSPEARAALRYLSRGFFGPPELKIGSSWSIDHSGTGFTERAKYRINALPDGEHATVAFEQTRAVRGARFIEANEHGTLTYETKMVVPQRLETQVHTVETIGTRRRSTDEAFGFDLRFDSFEGRSG